MLGYIVIQVIFLIYLIIVGIITIRYSLKCADIISCNNMNCRYRNFCPRYEESITEEEAKELTDFINTFKK